MSASKIVGDADTPNAGNPGARVPYTPVALLEALDGWLAETGHDDGHPWRVSIAETLEATPDSDDWMGAGFGDLKRLELAYRAAAEIDANQRMLRREVDSSEDPIELELVASSALRRIGAMANAVMAAINDGCVTTAELTKSVYGAEVTNG